MTLAFVFHPEARAEFFADVDWYDSPESWAVWPGWDREPMVRSKGVDGFPYRVVYCVAGEWLAIVAVARTKRRPGYWRDRVSL